MTAIGEFERLEAEVVEATVRLGEAQAHRVDRVAALEQAEGALHEHVAGVHAGEREPDPEVEDRLHADALAAGEVVSVRLVNYGQGSEARLVDLKAEARVAGAERAVERAEAELRAFAAEHLAELAVELAQGPSAEVGARAAAALAAAGQASREWNRIYARWTVILKWADSAELLQSAPQSPFAGLAPAEGVIVERGPVPRALVE